MGERMAKKIFIKQTEGVIWMKGSKAILKGHFVQFKKILKFKLADELENIKKTLNERVKKTCCSVAKSCLTLCDPVDCSASGSPVLHYLQEFAQTHIHWVTDAILCRPFSPPALDPSHHQGLFWWLFTSDGPSTGASAEVNPQKGGGRDGILPNALSLERKS